MFSVIMRIGPRIIPHVYFCVFQAIKESATELLFGGHETTASTATSLIMFLGLNPEVVDRMRQELLDKVIIYTVYVYIYKIWFWQIIDSLILQRLSSWWC